MSRGRTARTPTKIPRKGWLDVAARVYRTVVEDNLSLLAAGIAFYGLLSLFPAITAAVALAGMVTDPSYLIDTSVAVSQVLPSAAAEILMGQLNGVVSASNNSLGWAAVFAIGLALWSASKAVENLIVGLNVINGERERRSLIVLKLMNLAMTLCLIIGILVTVGVVAAMPAIAAYVSRNPQFTELVLFIRWPVLFLVGVFGIAMLYRFGPSRRRAKWRWLTPGAGLACALWVTGSIAFSKYVQSFGSYNETFGTLGGVIILLYWLWLSAFILLFGATVDAEMEAQTRHETTVGPDRPMGRRGAVKADTLGALRGEPHN
ncbi:YihY/virulence factor BrkB family protein [Sagittula salina]|uniref:YihY/virulence factor BrkB family protein n=1 Tax=Sagittula salina TaxID=2820268 RepID=A0A940MQM1_9RHOB|nr:YihY/virulence factor BrkB family protein [Sagittula salina]MBP0483187.1 YihY/virulence factor BrkB family protein [Sagittula salina]